MNPKRLDEIEALLDEKPFRAWWVDLKAVRAELRAVRERKQGIDEQLVELELSSERHQKLAIDALDSGSEAEERAAALDAEVSRIENQAIAMVGAFEDQRARASDGWVKLGAAEKRLEEASERLAAKKATVSGDASRLAAEVERLTREHRIAKETYDRESSRKESMWREVESLWTRAAELGLLGVEKRLQAGSKKKEAERHLQDAEREKARVTSLGSEIAAVDESLAELEKRAVGRLALAKEKLGAMVGDSFLYWPCSDDDKQVWCLSLVSDSSTYGIEVEPLSIYRATVRDGVSGLEESPLFEAEEVDSDCG